MEKISLKKLNSLEIEPLSREEMKNLFGGGDDTETLPNVPDSGGSANPCLNSQGGCDIAANCKRTSGAAGKCGGPSCTCS